MAMRSRRRLHRSAGFTMTEMMVALTITVILATLAVPSFKETIARSKTKSVASELYASLARTRSEALSRNATIIVTPKAGKWESGWTISNPAADAPIDDRGPTSGLTVTGPDSVSYTASGRLPATSAPRFIITATSSTTATACVSVDLSGRPYMKMAATC